MEEEHAHEVELPRVYNKVADILQHLSWLPQYTRWLMPLQPAEFQKNEVICKCERALIGKHKSDILAKFKKYNQKNKMIA